MQVLYTTMMTTTIDGMQEKECTTYEVIKTRRIFFLLKRPLFSLFCSLVHKQYLVVCTMGGGQLFTTAKFFKNNILLLSPFFSRSLHFRECSMYSSFNHKKETRWTLSAIQCIKNQQKKQWQQQQYETYYSIS